LLSHVPERDIVTPSGKVLTLINATYMARLVFESSDFKEEVAGRGHLTSLNPIRPENRPDSWEEKALHKFEQGVKEVSELQVINGRTYMRLIRASITEKPCLKCHESQGYQEGDIRGGVGVIVPISDILDANRPQVVGGSFAHGFVWLLGLGVLGISSRKLSRSVSALQESEEALRNQTVLLEQNEEELRELSLADDLTGLTNRRGFILLARQQMKVADRSRKKICLLYADLDGLKSINDTLGHVEGDRAIVDMATILKKSFRASDIVARLGGDEFVALSVEDSADVEKLIKERLLENLHEYKLDFPRPYELSVSFGISTHDPNHPERLEDFIDRGDRLMYEHKRSKK
jgi:diguanylate cyclase (GGDEF)-like protein